MLLALLWLTVLGSLIYGAITYIFWRNINLKQPWKAIFCLTVLPFFIVAIIINIVLVDRYAPWLWDAILRSRELGQKRFERGYSFLFTAPVGILLIYLWYRFLSICANAIGAKGRAPE